MALVVTQRDPLDGEADVSKTVTVEFDVVDLVDIVAIESLVIWANVDGGAWEEIWPTGQGFAGSANAGWTVAFVGTPELDNVVPSGFRCQVTPDVAWAKAVVVGFKVYVESSSEPAIFMATNQWSTTKPIYTFYDPATDVFLENDIRTLANLADYDGPAGPGGAGGNCWGCEGPLGGTEYGAVGFGYGTNLWRLDSKTSATNLATQSGFTLSPPHSGRLAKFLGYIGQRIAFMDRATGRIQIWNNEAGPGYGWETEILPPADWVSPCISPYSVSMPISPDGKVWLAYNSSLGSSSSYPSLASWDGSAWTWHGQFATRSSMISYYAMANDAIYCIGGGKAGNIYFSAYKWNGVAWETIVAGTGNYGKFENSGSFVGFADHTLAMFEYQTKRIRLWDLSAAPTISGSSPPGSLGYAIPTLGSASVNYSPWIFGSSMSNFAVGRANGVIYHAKFDQAALDAVDHYASLVGMRTNGVGTWGGATDPTLYPAALSPVPAWSGYQGGFAARKPASGPKTAIPAFPYPASSAFWENMWWVEEAGSNGLNSAGIECYVQWVGATAKQTIPAGGGSFSIDIGDAVSSIGMRANIGISPTSSAPFGTSEIEWPLFRFFINLPSHNMYAFYNGAYQWGGGPTALGDNFKIAVSAGGVVTLYRNGGLVKTFSQNTGSVEMTVICALWNPTAVAFASADNGVIT